MYFPADALTVAIFGLSFASGQSCDVSGANLAANLTKVRQELYRSMGASELSIDTRRQFGSVISQSRRSSICKTEATDTAYVNAVNALNTNAAELETLVRLQRRDQADSSVISLLESIRTELATLSVEASADEDAFQSALSLLSSSANVDLESTRLAQLQEQQCYKISKSLNTMTSYLNQAMRYSGKSNVAVLPSECRELLTDVKDYVRKDSNLRNQEYCYGDSSGMGTVLSEMTNTYSVSPVLLRTLTNTEFDTVLTEMTTTSTGILDLFAAAVSTAEAKPSPTFGLRSALATFAA